MPHSNGDSFSAVTCLGPRKIAAPRSSAAKPRPKRIALPAGMYMSSCTDVSVFLARRSYTDCASRGQRAAVEFGSAREGGDDGPDRVVEPRAAVEVRLPRGGEGGAR